MTTNNKLLCLLSLTLWMAQNGCTREYVILRGAYQTDNDAREKVGRTLPNNRDAVQMLGPNQVFKADAATAAQPFTGNDVIKKEVNASLLAQVKANVNKVCTVNGQVGPLDINKTSNEIVAYQASISPVVSAWRPESAGGCCNVDGTVNNACSTKSAVTIAIYKAKVSFTSSLRVGVPINADVQCLNNGNANDNGTNVAGKVTVSVGVNNSASVDSEGWNIVQVLTLKDVCANLRSMWNVPTPTPRT